MTTLHLDSTQAQPGDNSYASPLVLIADPEVPTAELLRGVFEHEGYRVEMVHDENLIIEAIESLRPDLIILETLLGRTSGFDVLRHLHDNPETASIPTFLLTTNADWPDVLQGLELGADDTMRKPVHPREMLARAESKIRARRLEEALQRRTYDLEALLRVSEALNQNHDLRVLEKLLLALLCDLLPITCAVITVTASGSKLESVSVNPEHRRTEVTRWITKRLGVLRKIGALHPLAGDPGSDFAHVLALPLPFIDRTEVIPYLIAFSAEPLDITHVQLFEGMGRQANLALRNAELYRLQANYAQQLEEKVVERTRELQSTQKQLIQAEKLATVGRLAAGIAHEINNPLMPIKINLESILEDIQTSRDVEEDMVLTTLESVDRIKRLVQRLLEYNAGQTGSAESMTTLDVNEVIEAVQDLTRKTFKQTGKVIVLDLHDVPPVQGSRDALTQVFINLALNASEAMSDGGTLTITTKRVKNEVLIEFTDTGVGIPANMLDRIFDPFTTTKANGSGLGLFVSYGIIEGHGGAIKVKSTPGKGSTFTVTLPVATSAGSD